VLLAQKYQTEYREVSEIKSFILNHNFSILLDTCIGYGYGTHFEVSVIHRSELSNASMNTKATTPHGKINKKSLHKKQKDQPGST